VSDTPLVANKFQRMLQGARGRSRCVVAGLFFPS